MPEKVSGRNFKRFALQMLTVVLLTGFDLLIKFFAERDLQPLGERVLIPGVLGLRYLRNTGAALGVMSEMTNLLSLITGVAILGLIIYLFFTKNNDRVYHILLPLIIAGGAGNLVDRLTRGYVVDYLEFLFVNFAVFNIADIFVTCSAFALVGYLLFTLIREIKPKPQSEHETV